MARRNTEKEAGEHPQLVDYPDQQREERNEKSKTKQNFRDSLASGQPELRLMHSWLVHPPSRNSTSRYSAVLCCAVLRTVKLQYGTVFESVLLASTRTF